jgi:hypothetical protein
MKSIILSTFFVSLSVFAADGLDFTGMDKAPKRIIGLACYDNTLEDGAEDVKCEAIQSALQEKGYQVVVGTKSAGYTPCEVQYQNNGTCTYLINTYIQHNSPGSENGHSYRSIEVVNLTKTYSEGVSSVTDFHLSSISLSIGIARILSNREWMLDQFDSIPNASSVGN